MGRKPKPSDFKIHAAARHGMSAELIDIGLHNYVRQGDNGVLHAGGKSDGQNSRQHGHIRLNLPPANLIFRAGAGEPIEGQHRTEALGNGSGPRRVQRPRRSPSLQRTADPTPH